MLVASSAKALDQDRADLWNSGRVDSDRSVLVLYAGRPLESRTRCFWKVRSWDKDGRPSAWSTPATWTMGILQPDEWKAQWIGTEIAPPAVPAGGQLNLISLAPQVTGGQGLLLRERRQQ